MNLPTGSKGENKNAWISKKLGTTWSYIFDIGKVNGKRKQKEKGGFRTKTEAQSACGLRRGGVFGLTWGYVDVEKSTVHVSKNT